METLIFGLYRLMKSNVNMKFQKIRVFLYSIIKLKGNEKNLVALHIVLFCSVGVCSGDAWNRCAQTA
jgi:hypothetical protein